MQDLTMTDQIAMSTPAIWSANVRSCIFSAPIITDYICCNSWNVKAYRATVCISFSVLLFSLLSRMLYTSFAGQLSMGDKERLDGLLRTAFKRGLCCHVFKVDELINDADRKLFRQISHHTHCLHPLLPQQRPRSLQQSLRSRGHNYSLPHIEFSLYKNSFVNRCLFNMI